MAVLAKAFCGPRGPPKTPCLVHTSPFGSGTILNTGKQSSFRPYRRRVVSNSSTAATITGDSDGVRVSTGSTITGDSNGVGAQPPSTAAADKGKGPEALEKGKVPAIEEPEAEAEAVRPSPTQGGIYTNSRRPNARRCLGPQLRAEPL
jgi:hypothetical protein